MFQTLNFLAGDRSAYAAAISEDGVAAGESSNQCGYDYAWTPTDTPGTHAVLWSTEAVVLNLGALPGFNPIDSRATGLNNRGQVVGQSGRMRFSGRNQAAS
ncbi:MAG TPA: hypothetical protein VHE78_07650 [Gemmatimonadaceae bacterium]|nr:hypothetical protein [Gemmatimonadaceae bacterium]